MARKKTFRGGFLIYAAHSSGKLPRRYPHFIKPMYRRDMLTFDTLCCHTVTAFDFAHAENLAIQFGFGPVLQP